MEKYLNLLKKCPLFIDISEDDILKLLACLNAKVTYFDKKYTIFAEGSPAKYVGILLSGTAQVIQFDYYGNKSILSHISASEVFAEEFACSDIDDLPVTVVADEPCEVMYIDSTHILHTCPNNCRFHQTLIYNLMKDLAAKTIMFHQKIEVTSKRTTREKLLTYLTIQSRNSKSQTFEIPFDRQELADYLEVDRSGLSVIISNLCKEGVIRCSKNRFEIL